MENKEVKIRYLEMIQNVITRMASNSFLLKGWTVTIVVGLLAFANLDDMDSKYIFIALVPTLFFWILDGFFIHQEWLYIKLFEFAATLDESEVDFSMNANHFKEVTPNLFQAFFSKTLMLFYIPITCIIILAILSFPHLNI